MTVLHPMFGIYILFLRILLPLIIPKGFLNNNNDYNILGQDYHGLRKDLISAYTWFRTGI